MGVLGANKAKFIKVTNDKFFNNLQNSGKTVQDVFEKLDNIVLISSPPENCKKVKNIYITQDGKLNIEYFE